MGTSAGKRWAGLLAVAIAAGALAARGVGAGTGNAAPGVEAQYAAVLAAMKMPAVTGVLVTEVAPDSAAEAAGIQGGDIIVSYRGSPIRTLADLRAAVSEALAEGMTGQTPGGVAAGDAGASGIGGPSKAVLLEVRRAGQAKPVELRIAREPLGIRAVEVTAQVAVEGNPPPSLRGHVAMAWDEVIANDTGEDASIGGMAWFWSHEVGGMKVNWQRRSLRVVGEHEVEGRLEVFADDGSDGGKGPAGAPVEDVDFVLRGGDYEHAPAFVLLSVGRHNAGEVERTAERAGLNLKVMGQNEPAPLDSVVSAAVPYVAAAMPHEAGAVLAMHLTSVRDFVSRPGYVLITRGKQPFGITAAGTQPAGGGAASEPATRRAGTPSAGWRVDLQQCGVVVESYWFDEKRGLVREETGGGTPVVTRRVPSEEAARMAPERDAPATQPDEH